MRAQVRPPKWTFEQSSSNFPLVDLPEAERRTRFSSMVNEQISGPASAVSQHVPFSKKTMKLGAVPYVPEQEISLGAGAFEGAEGIDAISADFGALCGSWVTCGSGLEIGTSGLPQELRKIIPVNTTKTRDKRAIVPRFKISGREL